jgi:hypothetical protein
MQVEEITIKSPITSKSGASPIGEGMIFLSDTLFSLENISAFTQFTKENYNEWRLNRAKDIYPLSENEPVAYFSFEEKAQISFSLEC